MSGTSAGMIGRASGSSGPLSLHIVFGSSYNYIGFPHSVRDSEESDFLHVVWHSSQMNVRKARQKLWVFSWSTMESTKSLLLQGIIFHRIRSDSTWEEKKDTRAWILKAWSNIESGMASLKTATVRDKKSKRIFQGSGRFQRKKFKNLPTWLAQYDWKQEGMGYLEFYLPVTILFLGKFFILSFIQEF